MNMISFANFDNLDKQKSFFNEPDGEQPTEDFSAILSNISVCLQTTDAPVKTSTPEDGEFKLALEIPTGRPIPAEPLQTGNKLLEIPIIDPTTTPPTQAETTPEISLEPELWAGRQYTMRHPLANYKSEYATPEKLKSQISQIIEAPTSADAETGTLFQAETVPPPTMEILIADEKPGAAAVQSQTIPAADVAKLFQAEPTSPKQRPIDINPKTYDEENPPIEFNPQTPIDINPPVKIQPPIDINPQVETNQPAPSEQSETSVPPIAGAPIDILIPAETEPVPPVKNDKYGDIPIVVMPVPNQPAPVEPTDVPTPLFQSVDKEKGVRFEKPVLNNRVPDPKPPTTKGPTIENPTVNIPKKAPKEYLPTTIPVEPAPNAETIDTAEILPQIPAGTELPDSTIKFEIATETMPEISGVKIDADAKLVEFKADSNLPEIAIQPQFNDKKLNGFSITPNEVQSILKTFDRFFKASEQKLTSADPLNQEVISDGSESFSEITSSIKDSFESIIRDADSNARLKKSEAFQPAGNLWSGELATDKAVKVPVQPFSQKNVFNEFRQAQSKVVTNDGGNVVPVNLAQPPVVVTNTQKDFEVKNNAGFKVDELAENTKTDFLGLEQPVAETGRTANKSEPTFERPQTETAENDFGGAVKFDKFFENVAKSQNSVEPVKTAETDPAKVIEQVNPHLIELAALAEKKREKQTLKLRLNPAELGSVEIKLERNSSGTLNAYFQTETEGARQALSQNLEQLRDSLQNAGWQVGQMEISTGSNSSTANQDRESNSRPSETFENFSFSRSSDKPDAAEERSSNRLLSLLA